MTDQTTKAQLLRFAGVSWSYLLPVAGLVTFALLFHMLQSVLALNSMTSEDLTKRALNLGIFWAACDLLLMMAIVFAFALSIDVVRKECARSPRIEYKWPLIAFCVIATPMVYWL